MPLATESHENWNSPVTLTREVVYSLDTAGASRDGAGVKTDCRDIGGQRGCCW
jgi:hypothetical protein